jgi:hypothetical protein
MTPQKLYFAVEVQYIHGTPVGLLWRPDVPVYVCYFGSGADAQIQEEGCFAVHDDRNRLWFCRELHEIPEPGEPTFVEQLFRMGYLAHKIGINEGGAMWHGNADDLDDLRDQLGSAK